MFSMGWQDISCLKVKWLILLLGGILFTHSILSLVEAEEPAPALIVSIPFAEEQLAANDPNFVALKLAFKRLFIDVDFVVLPGARSLKMLKKGKIAGNYPRFSEIADANNTIIKLNYFNAHHEMYAFSLDKTKQGKFFNILNEQSTSIGVVRGVKVIEDKYIDVNIHWFTHIDHLIGAFKIGRVKYILEREDVVLPYEKKGLVFYRSKNAVFIGKLTLVLHESYRDIAVQLDNYFNANHVEPQPIKALPVEG